MSDTVPPTSSSGSDPAAPDSTPQPTPVPPSSSVDTDASDAESHPSTPGPAAEDAQKNAASSNSDASAPKGGGESSSSPSGKLKEEDEPNYDEKNGPSVQTTKEGSKQNEPSGPTVVVRYGLMGFMGEFRYNLKRDPRPGDKVVVRTDRGVELGEVVSLVEKTGPRETCDGCRSGRCITPETLTKYIDNSSENYPFRRGGRVLRLANSQDLIDYRHLRSSATEESKYCRQQIQALSLPMRLVTAEHMLGGERIVFYFTAESRVDFRTLVRNLASQFRTRIEMRQVGARDEARLVADYERCGQRCCCQQYLKDLKPVSMRMAKVQKATLDPTKISGRCGRLMCCLRYEDECYEELKKNLPRRNTWVRTTSHIGRVVDGQIITQLVRLALYDGSFIAVPVDEIVERDIAPPSEEELRSHAVKQAAQQREEARKAMESISITESSSEASGQEASQAERESARDETAPKTKRRRRRKKPSGNASQEQSQPQGQQKKNKGSSNSSGNTNQNSQKKKKRRRRRRKKPGGGGDGSNSSRKE